MTQCPFSDHQVELFKIIVDGGMNEYVPNEHVCHQSRPKKKTRVILKSHFPHDISTMPAFFQAKQPTKRARTCLPHARSRDKLARDAGIC
jgi:hypothetical protein